MTSWRPIARSAASRYRIEVMADTAADVVRSLGGLLFDRRCLGWDTLVLLDDCADIRPLQIIGADCADLESALDMPEQPRAAPSPPPCSSTAATPAYARGSTRPSTAGRPKWCCGVTPSRSAPSLK